ncbi:hypothetical protein DL96DRAFT_1558249 [Flagelloscypha sp. PMI_526]|nr:hypothetical protein DL96DRAFT_1558249 [Flagelloscypha sp. PMI_526]
MSRPPSHTDSTDPQGLPQHLAQKFHKFLLSVNTPTAFVIELENAILETRWQNSIPSWLANLKDFARKVSDDLAAVTCLTGTLSSHGTKTMRQFWSSVLAIAGEYHKQGRVLEALVAMLEKIHGTTRSLRLLSPVKNDLQEVTKLHQTIICLLSCVLPRPFLGLGHRSPAPDKLIHLPEIQENLQKMTDQVNLLHYNAYNREVTAMGCPRADP